VSRRAALFVALAAATALTGCQPKRKPVIPRAVSVERSDFRQAVEGRDSTVARLAWPEFVGARTPEALDSLRATVRRMLLAPLDGGREAGSTPALLDGFIARWNAARQRTHTREFWRYQRRIVVLGETLGVVSLARADEAQVGGGRRVSRLSFANVGADDGRTLGFDQVFRAGARESLSAAIEPLFRAARGVPADTSLDSLGFRFAGGHFLVNDNFAVAPDGVRWHFDPGEVAPIEAGPTELLASHDAMRPFARDDGPLGRKRR
jgi:hypothetical protein